ncbi:CmcI family methyltransferase [Pantoea sp. BAV 3049]|uniref:CmcI family methyltransferase n=1 Tax=Pantoea sp. BAV 3049 TaxID=2654188 RepID=UPI00131CE653|nr:CmcI family methyltransferase [Pantoea sp. BAV 3049]
MKTLFELYENHHGKSSDKWSIYLNTYHETLSKLQPLPVSFLEIGVQNGGSLDIWSQYFPNAVNIIGCDIDEKCSLLTYDKDNISVIIGDSSTQEVKERIEKISPEFDVIIDDGSHDSSDIIKSFLLYFPLIKEDGYYIIEDLHCSYWQNFEGGLYDPYSSMAFLKKLGDIPNYEHWGTAKSEHEYLKPFYEYYQCNDLDNVDYTEIHSVQFINSLCIIQKRKKESNVLGPRVISGEIETVVEGHQKINGSFNIPQDQSNNPWRDMPTFPEMEWSRLVESNRNDTATIEQLERDVVFYKSIEDTLRLEIEIKNKDINEKDQLIQRLSYDNNALRTSTSWKLTLPLRKSVTELRKIKKGLEVSKRVVSTYGIKDSISRANIIYQQKGLRGIIDKVRFLNQLHHSSTIVERKSLGAVDVPAQDVLMPKILLISELSIPQCKKYRVDQKVELFKKLGIPTTVLHWSQQNECIEALQSHSLVIFYRVPGYETMDPVFAECERLNLPTFWEVDDLIFDQEVMRHSKTLQALDKHTYNALLDGAALYKRAMLKCRGVIASTQHLADAMVAAGAPYAYVIENALDPETIITAQGISSSRLSETDGIIRIVYGSGTTTHNIDFLEASQAILNVLKANQNVHFRLIGELDLPSSFDDVQSQIERVALCPYQDYLRVLAECDINLAPLEDYVFNYSKSNIKYIEASILGLPSVCSPRPTFSRVIEHGENGFLCESTGEWESVLNQLIDSAELRHDTGHKAQNTVLHHYSPENIAHQQVSHLTDNFIRIHANERKNVLSVNCYYNPRSFGGATVVAEEMNKRFDQNQDINIHVLTSLSEEYAAPYQLRRYGAYKHECFGIGLPSFVSETDQILNKKIDIPFQQVLDIVKPDIVHLHSIQGLGLSMVDLCKSRNIPVIVTAHDFWWLYENQFILSYDDKHKERGVLTGHETKPIFDKEESKYYVIKKRNALSRVHKILAPSQFTHDLYVNEGFINTTLNKNGVNYPMVMPDRQVPTKIRFGYIGGNTQIKGFHLIQAAFKGFSSADVELVIVDNTLNLGFSSFSKNDLENFPSYTVVPAFTQQDMDAFYSSIDVLLYPTQSKESFGLTVREALIRNVWVITSDAGGAAEDIIEGQNGLVIPFDNDAERLKVAISQTLAHFKSMPQGKLETSPHAHIRSFDEQYNELVDIYLTTH